MDINKSAEVACDNEETESSGSEEFVEARQDSSEEMAGTFSPLFLSKYIGRFSRFLSHLYLKSRNEVLKWVLAYTPFTSELQALTFNIFAFRFHAHML